jgi:hypothetical protein
MSTGKKKAFFVLQKFYEQIEHWVIQVSSLRVSWVGSATASQYQKMPVGHRPGVKSGLSGKWRGE